MYGRLIKTLHGERFYLFLVREMHSQTKLLSY